MLFAVGGGAPAVAASSGAPLAQRQNVALGTHTLLTQPDGEGSNPAVSAPVATQATGSSLLVLVGGYVSNAGVPSDTYGNRWVQQGPRIRYHAYQGRFDTVAYTALAAKGGPGHRLSLPKNGAPAGEVTAAFIEIEHAGVLQDAAYNYPVPGAAARLAAKLGRALPGDARTFSSAALTSGEVTTTGPATLVAVWWGDAYVYAMTAVPDGGFRVIERFLDLPPSSGVQCAVAVKQVDRAGTYRVTWKDAPAQGAILWLFAFQAKR